MGRLQLSLALLLVIQYGWVDALEVVCQIHLQLPISAELAEELRHCTVYIATSVTFDINQSTVLSSEELSLIDVLKRSNSSADVLLTVVLPFNVTMLSTHGELCERIAIVLRDNSLDGVDLDLDVAQLDYFEQIRYAQFLRRLRALLCDKYKISTTIGCTSLEGAPKALPKAMNDQLDMVTVVGAELADGTLIGSGSEFILRHYSFEPVKRLIKEGISAEKIVLSLMTVGIVFHPGSYRTTRSLQRSRVGVLSYGQVCELLLELDAKCGDSGSRRRLGCSLFNGKGVVVYDGESSVDMRIKQAVDIGAKGVLILPNYDDSENLCAKGSFPLISILKSSVATQRSSKSTTNDLLCSDGYRYGGLEEEGLYYKCYNERIQQNDCQPGTVFNDLLQICLGINVPPIVLKEDNQLLVGSDKLSTIQTNHTTSSTDIFINDLPVTEFPEPEGPMEEPLQNFLDTFQNILSFLDSIIQRALALVLRLEFLEHSLRNDTSAQAAGDYSSEETDEQDTDPPLVPVVDETFFSSNSVIGAINNRAESEESAESELTPTSGLIWPLFR